MKPLSPRYESFAQARARGETEDAAYVAAGYKQHDGNAARLSGNERILQRVKATEDFCRGCERAVRSAALVIIGGFVCMMVSFGCF